MKLSDYGKVQEYLEQYNDINETIKGLEAQKKENGIRVSYYKNEVDNDGVVIRKLKYFYLMHEEVDSIFKRLTKARNELIYELKQLGVEVDE